MRLALTIVAGILLSLAAPVVTLFYRGGWFNTPDDPVSPRGTGEEFMRKLHAKVGPWLADYWWLGYRNRAYGFAYAMKPSTLKMTDITMRVRWHGPVLTRCIEILGHKEWTHTVVVSGKAWFSIIVGYRLRPILDEVLRNAGRIMWDVPHRPINMDARPFISIRFGYDD